MSSREWIFPWLRQLQNEKKKQENEGMEKKQKEIKSKRNGH